MTTEPSPIDQIRALHHQGVPLAEAKDIVHAGLTPEEQANVEKLWDQLEEAVADKTEVLITIGNKGQHIAGLDGLPLPVRNLLEWPKVTAIFVELGDETIFYRKLPSDHRMREGLEQLERMRGNPV